MKSLVTLFSLGVLIGSACVSGEPGAEDIEQDSFSSTGKDELVEGSREALAVLQVANTASVEVLAAPAPGGVGLASNAVAKLNAVRLGTDGVPGTADDVTLDSLAALDAVPFIGRVALGKLLVYARGCCLAPGSAQSREIANLIRYYDAWMGTDKQVILSFYADVDDAKGLNDRGSGIEMSFRNFADAFVVGFPGMRHEITSLRRIDARNLEVFFDFKAKHTGEFFGIPASGNDVNVPCKGIYTFDDEGKVTHLDLTYDGADFIAQLQR
jgi:predicted ester cyclase